jgi:hypothetical protein
MKNNDPQKLSQLSIRLKSGGELHLSEYSVTFEPIKQKLEEMPESVRHQIQSIYFLIPLNPELAIEKLLVLKEQYPQIPMLYNHLSVAYGLVGNQKAIQQVTDENYRKNPGYLFAKLGYAQECLYSGKFKKIPAIFDNKFDLKILYPDREIFHVTEFAGFTAVMCAYFSCIGEKAAAEILYRFLIKVYPESDMILFARIFLYPSLVRRIINWLGSKDS